MNQFDINKEIGESALDFIIKVCEARDFNPEMTWEDVKHIVNNALGYSYSNSWYRKNYANNSFPKFLREQSSTTQETDTSCDSISSDVLAMRKERVKLADERSQMMAAVRKIAREETLLEIAKQVADIMKVKPVLPNYEYLTVGGTKSAILQISDWHYGIEINNPWNVYNPDIAKDRIIKLRSKVIELIKEHKVKDLYIANLGDLISGRIHETIRIQNRIDVITQCLEVTEILVEFIACLSQYVNIKYISTSDNHSRMEPKKELSIDLESLTRVMEPLLRSRIQNLQYENKCKNVEFIDSPYGPDIATFNIYGYKVGAVHGHKDSPKMVVKNISLMTRNNYDLILSAHLHHFAAEEEYSTVVISNGSLMGVDDYAETLRVMSEPSQNLLILTEDCVVESIHRIVLK